MFKRRKGWGEGVLFHDARTKKTDYIIYIDPRKDGTFNENVELRENDSGRLIKLAFRPDGIYLLDDNSKKL